MSVLSGRVVLCSTVVLLLGLALRAVLPLHWKVATRSYELERQDRSMEEGRYTLEEFQDLMAMLAELNRADWKGGYKASLAHFDELTRKEGPINSILEIGK